jgi:tetratricopeptide (TPR) repeat protein
MASQQNNFLHSQLQSLGLLGLLTISLYGLLTVLPDSTTMVVSWPWVFIWQVTLFLPWLWLLRQGWTDPWKFLGHRLDLWVGFTVVVLVCSTLFAQFPQQAGWYGWSMLCGLAALYSSNRWCDSREQRLFLFQIQGGIAVAVIVLSLMLWFSQTVLPELARLDGLRAAGFNLSYNFATLELRNWAPFGHQNYVAGYVVLNLPILLALGILHKTRWGWFWLMGAGLALVVLYTTSSRAGWLGLAVMGGMTFLGLLLKRGTSNVLRFLGGLGLLVGLGSLFVVNDRLRSLLSPTVVQEGGETAYRVITNTTGWLMGLAHPWFGVGLGGVPLLYQAYRPAWAGRESEALYQLHSTPAQIWAELGIGGVLIVAGFLVWLGWWGIKLWQKREAFSADDRLLIWSCYTAYAGYGMVSLTDFQLDVIGISGSLLVYTVVLLSILRDYWPDQPIVQPKSWLKQWRWGVIGLLLAIGIWLIPIQRAWQLSSLGFAALDQKQVDVFVSRLEEAQKLAPWEPYYPYQLGWNLGQQGLQTQSAPALAKAAQAMAQGNGVSPHQEFGQSNLGWLQLFTGQIKQAMGSFQKAARLVPAKKGGFHSLGLSLLGQGKTDLAIESFALEILRDPMWLTSPVWRSGQLSPLYPKIQQRAIALYRKMLQGVDSKSSIKGYLHQGLGSIYWWQGDLKQAQPVWEKWGSPLSKVLLNVSSGKSFPPQAIAQPKTATDFLFKAWQDPQQRSQWAAKALLYANSAVPDPQQVEQLVASMGQAKTFDAWVKLAAPVREWRRERAGFGVLSRHIDGTIPKDFYPIVENSITTQFFAEVFPSPFYLPELDKALQPFQQNLLAQVERL